MLLFILTLTLTLIFTIDSPENICSFFLNLVFFLLNLIITIMFLCSYVLIFLLCSYSFFRLLLDHTLDVNERFFTMKMIYGAQSDDFDFHYMGFDGITLPTLLSAHGFCDLKRVGNFNIIQDTSSMVYHGREISLNIAGRKCGKSASGIVFSDPSSPYYPPRE